MGNPLSIFNFNVKNLIYSFVFLVCFLCGDRIFSYLLMSVVLKSQATYSKIYEGNSNYQIVLLGNSRIVSSLCPSDIFEKTRKTTLQLGYKGLSIRLAEAIIKDYTEFNEKPNFVIIGVTSLTTKNDVIYDLKIYSGTSKRIETILRKLDKKVYYLTKIFNLYMFNSEMLLSSFYYFSKTDQDRGKYSTRVFDQDSVDGNISKHSDLGRLELSKINVEALNNILDYLDQREIKVMLYFPPIHPLLLQEERMRIAEFIKQLSLETKVDISDYSSVINNPKYFKDLTHLNYEGSKQFLDILLKDRKSLDWGNE